MSEPGNQWQPQNDPRNGQWQPQRHPAPQRPMPPHPAQHYPMPPQQYPAAPMIVNNIGGFGGRPPRKPQSVLIHLLLLVFTWGIGNVIYGLYVHNWNSKRGL